MGTWLSGLSTYAMQSVDQFQIGAVVALFCIAGLMEFGIPFPLILDGVLLLLGYQIGLLWQQTLLIIPALLLGRIIGSSIVYWLASLAVNATVRRLRKCHPIAQGAAARIPQKLGAQSGIVVAIARLCARIPAALNVVSFGTFVPGNVAVSRLTPGLLTLTSVVSGVSRVRYWHFVAGVAIASLLTDIGETVTAAGMGYLLVSFGIRYTVWLALPGLAVLIGVAWITRRFLLSRTSHAKRPAPFKFDTLILHPCVRAAQPLLPFCQDYGMAT